MDHIILDLEWNQPISQKRAVRTPFVLLGEIIQIGAVRLDDDCRAADTFKITVSPQYYTEMNECVSALTGITEENLRHGLPFPTAFEYFKKWCGGDFDLLTWGPDDIYILKSNLAVHKLNPEQIPKTYDIQRIFDSQISKENRKISLERAMEKVGEPALAAHDALNDAQNAASVCRHIDIKKGISEYGELSTAKRAAKSREKERDAAEKTYSSVEEILGDEEQRRFFCPRCGKPAECRDFYGTKQKWRSSIAECENGHKILVRFNFQEWPDGKLSVKRKFCE